MTTPVILTDEKKNTPSIIDRGLVVTNNPTPPPSQTEFLQIPFVRALAIDGGDITDLTVDGSINSIDAFVKARSDGDLYIKVVNIIIEGAGNIALEDFGNITGGLTNGIDTFIQNEDVKFAITQVPIFTNLDAIRIGTLNPAIGTDASAFRIKQTQGGGDTLYNPVWDLTKLSAGVEGVVLSANTNQKLGITINDDLTGLTSFTIIVLGYLRIVR